MTDLEYLNHAENALSAVELACDRINDATDADIDNQRTGGMITLTFANRSQIIIHCRKSGWLPNPAAFITSSMVSSGRTPKAPASFLVIFRAMQASSPSRRWYSARLLEVQHLSF